MQMLFLEFHLADRIPFRPFKPLADDVIGKTHFLVVHLGQAEIVYIRIKTVLRDLLTQLQGS